MAVLCMHPASHAYISQNACCSWGCLQSLAVGLHTCKVCESDQTEVVARLGFASASTCACSRCISLPVTDLAKEGGCACSCVPCFACKHQLMPKPSAADVKIWCLGAWFGIQLPLSMQFLFAVFNTAQCPGTIPLQLHGAKLAGGPDG